MNDSNNEGMLTGVPGGDRSHQSTSRLKSPESKHFWVSSYPYFESSLIIVPNLLNPEVPQTGSLENCSLENDSLISQTPLISQTVCLIELFDSGGEKINQAGIEFPSTDIYALELDPLLGGCKLESGLKHAHLHVRAEKGTGVFLRIYSKDAAAIVGEPVSISPTQGTFFPVTFSGDRANLLCCINTGNEEATLRCRLFFGKRSPEASWIIPPQASRVVSIESEFRQYATLVDGEQGQAYVRLSVKSGELAIQAIEGTEGPKEGGFYTSVS